MRPHEQSCPACGAPPERVTKKHWRVALGEHIAFRCEVCGKRWAEEVKPATFGGWTPEKFYKINSQTVLSDDDIKALQQALSSEETSASKLVEEAAQKICNMVTENMRLRQVRSSFQDDMCRAGKELTRLRDEVAELQRQCVANHKRAEEIIRARENQIEILQGQVTELLEKRYD